MFSFPRAAHGWLSFQRSNRVFWNRWLDLTFPRYCISCGGAHLEPPVQFVCGYCRSFLDLIEDPMCHRCGCPFPGQFEAVDFACPKCRQGSHIFGQSRAVFLLRGPGSVIIRVLKYRNGKFLRPDVQFLIRRDWSLLDYLEESILVPVPLHPHRLEQRGYNQSMLLAEWIAEVVSRSIVWDGLSRIRNTPTQTALDRETRQRNMSKAFALNPAAKVYAEKRHVLVDDVFTTGSTLDACAEILRKSGISKVDAFTLAHG